jgi:hypothetical protein
MKARAFRPAYGPPVPIYRIPRPWGLFPIRVARGDILWGIDNADGRTWLAIAGVADLILVAVSFARLRQFMPTLRDGEAVRRVVEPAVEPLAAAA